VAIKEQTIVDNVVTQLKTILISGGYHTDLGNNVFEWKSNKIDENELPAAIVRDVSDDVPVDEFMGIDDHTMNLEVEIVAKPADSTTEIRKMIADVINAAGKDETWTDQAHRTHLIGHEKMRDQSERLMTGAIVRFQVNYRTARLGET